MQILDGKKTSKEIKARIAAEIKDNGYAPGLAVVVAGENSAGRVYAQSAKNAFTEAGIEVTVCDFPNSVTQEELESAVCSLNEDPHIHGIIVQMPLPDHINKLRVIELIAPSKDVDGLTSHQLGRLFMNKPCLTSCTPYGVIRLLKEYNIQIAGKHAVVIGRSNIVGKPMAQLLLNEDATVTICHSKTKDLSFFTRSADILVSASGRINMVTADMVSQGAVVVDVGINNTGNGITGDVDFQSVAPKCSYITPVPGGVGAMTVATLMLNTLTAFKRQNGIE